MSGTFYAVTGLILLVIGVVLMCIAPTIKDSYKLEYVIVEAKGNFYIQRKMVGKHSTETDYFYFLDTDGVRFISTGEIRKAEKFPTRQAAKAMIDKNFGLIADFENELREIETIDDFSNKHLVLKALIEAERVGDNKKAIELIYQLESLHQ